MTKRIYLIDCPGIVPTSAHDNETSTVLKGVIRVEALPTPSDHIPALMERVKPIYLSRTYDVPLPESGVWDPETFLDKLARMKGRLLKGGGPDMDGVAKIVLSDWCRGRIPYFVPPPERSEELNQKEEEVRRKAKAKAKGKGKAEPEIRGVTQKLRGVLQKNTFIPEDIEPLEEAEDDVEAAEDVGAASQIGDGEASEPADEDDDDLTWDDVFEGIKQDIPVPNVDETEAQSVDENEEESKAAKDERMKTNKVCHLHPACFLSMD